jgi:GNAT superfamily N-acetyltransferase
MIAVRTVSEADLARIAAAENGPWWWRGEDQWRDHLDQQGRGDRVCLLAEIDGAIAAYGHLLWRTLYPPFAQAGIPEISDLRTGEPFRGQGAGSAIMARCEALARAAGCRAIGLGVGLYADYGSAQRLYARLGYAPDGRGLIYKNAPATPGERYRLDDELLLWMVKPLDAAR